MPEFAWWIYRAQIISYAHELAVGEPAPFDNTVQRYYGTSPLGRLWFEAMKPLLDPDAARYVEKLIAQPG